MLAALGELSTDAASMAIVASVIGPPTREYRAGSVADRPDQRLGGRPHVRPDRVGLTLCLVVVDAWSRWVVSW
jgi:hypothetical protein